MRRMASPAALSRMLSLQRANARAKSSRAESFSDHQSAKSQLPRKIDVLFTSTTSSNINVTESCNNIDTHNKPENIEPSKQLALQGIIKDVNHNIAKKRSLSADVPSGYKACFTSLSERIDKGIDLWDRDFSSMSSSASDQNGFLCGLQRRLNRDSNIFLYCHEPKSKGDACSKSSCSSEESLEDAFQMELDEPRSNIAYRLQSLAIEYCTGGSHSNIANQTLQDGDSHGLQGSDKQKLPLAAESSADAEGAKLIYRGEDAGNLDEYLMRRSGGHLTQCVQVGAPVRDAEAVKSPHSSTTDGSSRSEDHGKDDACLQEERLRVRSKRDYDKLEEEIMGSKRDYDNLEQGIGSSKIDQQYISCKEIRGSDEEGLVGLMPPDSVAVELVSVNVVQDFRESMYEMMMEKNMEEEYEDKSMQDLLNCYLLLNPSQLHGIIREVFSDVWIDIIMTTR